MCILTNAFQIVGGVGKSVAKAFIGEPISVCAHAVGGAISLCQSEGQAKQTLKATEKIADALMETTGTLGSWIAKGLAVKGGLAAAGILGAWMLADHVLASDVSPEVSIEPEIDPMSDPLFGHEVVGANSAAQTALEEAYNCPLGPHSVAEHAAEVRFGSMEYSPGIGGVGGKYYERLLDGTYTGEWEYAK